MWLRTIREHLPRRQKRFWRYVSPRRRGLGVLLLALLLAVVYGYWHFTNDHRIRRQARRYLQQLTGAEVRVDGARFSLFGGIRLDGVKLFIPGEDPRYPFFQARTVTLQHRPWPLLTTGRVLPTSIVCDGTIIRIEHNVVDNSTNAGKLLGMSGRHAGGGPLTADLPEIRVLNCQLRMIYREPGPHIVERVFPLDISLSPQQRRAYLLRFEESARVPKEHISGSILLDLVSGDMNYSGCFPVRVGVLPENYNKWLQRYRIGGTVHLPPQPAFGDEQGKIIAKLVNFSLKLPPAEGGLEMFDVTGTLEFEKEKVTIKRIAGRIRQAGDATFEMTGEYLGYKQDSPYSVHLAVTNMTLPKLQASASGLAGPLGKMHERFRPTGRMHLDARFARGSDGKVVFEGVMVPVDMAIYCKDFPYRLENLHGRVILAADGQADTDLTASRKGGRFKITGSIPYLGPGPVNLLVNVTKGVLNQEARKSLPKKMRKFWDVAEPSGAADARIHIHRKDKDTRTGVDVTITMKGDTSFKYAHFPYRLDKLIGEVRFESDKVSIDSLHGRRGKMHCRIDGSIKNLSSPPEDVDLRISAQNVPLDETLAAALKGDQRRGYESLRLSGLAESVNAVVRSAKKGKQDYTVYVTLRAKDHVKCKFDGFPYAMDDLAGELTIEPDRIILKELRGRHGKTPIVLSGQFYPKPKATGLDIAVKAAGIVLDRELYDALPPDMQEAWRQLSPAGAADVEFILRQNLPEAPGKTYYKLVLDAKDMDITYKEFPYPLRGISGRVVATPGRVDLHPLTGSHGKVRATISGSIVQGPKLQRANLAIRAGSIPVDKELLGAMPKEMAPLLERFQVGGTCEINLTSLLVTKSLRAVTRPASAPATAATTAGANLLAWSADGSVTFKDVAFDIGMGHQKLTGSLKGKGGRTPKGLMLDAAVKVDRVQMGHQSITDLTGRLMKTPAGTLIRLDQLAAKAHGGQLAGRAEMRLSNPLSYSISLSVKDIRLDDMFNAGVKDPKKKLNVKGLLDGTIQIKGIAGKTASRQATGMLRVSKAKFYKLPILLGFLHVVYLSLPSDSAFTDGYVAYHLRGGKLLFREIYLTGPALSIVGSGQMDMKTEALKLTFLAGPPGKIPRLSKLAEELQGHLVRELAEIHVTGTLTKPKWRTVPLRSLNAAVRQLLSPGG